MTEFIARNNFHSTGERIQYQSAVEKPLLALEALSKLNCQFANKPEFHYLVKTLLLTLSGQFSVGSAFAILRNPKATDSEFVHLATGKFSSNPLLESLKLTSDIEQYFLEYGSPGLMAKSRLKEYCPSYFNIFTDNNVILISPIIHNDKVLGAICLGEKVTKRPFKNEDVELFETLLNSITPLIASSYQFWEVASLNAWYFDILNNIKQGVFAFDFNNHLKKVNTRGLNILKKYYHEEPNSSLLLNLSLEEIFPEDIFKDWSRHFLKAVTENHNKSIENLIVELEHQTLFYDAYICRIGNDSKFQSDYIITLENVTERRKLEVERKARYERVKKQNLALFKMAMEPAALTDGDFTEVAGIMNEIVSEALNINRVGIWLFNDDHSRIECVDVYQKSKKQHDHGAIIWAEDFPRYFEAIENERVIASHDACTDPRTSEFAENYLMPNNIKSMLDAAIRISGKPVGIICHENIGEKRAWQTDEIKFAGEAADQVAQIMLNNEKRRAERHERELNTKLERAKKMEAIGVLAGGVAHDLNNMLGPLVGYPELILRKLPEDSPIRKQVQKIGNAAQSASSVIQDLLTLARRGRYEMKPLNLNQVIEEYLESPCYVQKCLDNPEVHLNRNLGSDISNILGSFPHLQKVIMNLIVNAYDAMPDGGSLTLTTSQIHLEKLIKGIINIEKGDYVALSVRDSGMGIKKEDLDHIFEPYYSNKKMSNSGSGLGLSVVYGVVKDHGGYYDVISEQGEGTEFILYFPITDKTAVLDDQSDDEYHGTEKILVVDDVKAQREIAADMLSSLGYKVHTAKSGKDAIKFLTNHNVDLIVLDMIMEKDFDGLDTYREIIKFNPNQKAVIVSGFSATDRVKGIQKLGAGPYIRKPYTLETISKAIREQLDKQ